MVTFSATLQNPHPDAFEWQFGWQHPDGTWLLSPRAPLAGTAVAVGDPVAGGQYLAVVHFSDPEGAIFFIPYLSGAAATPPDGTQVAFDQTALTFTLLPPPNPEFAPQVFVGVFVPQTTGPCGVSLDLRNLGNGVGELEVAVTAVMVAPISDTFPGTTKTTLVALAGAQTLPRTEFTADPALLATFENGFPVGQYGVEVVVRDRATLATVLAQRSGALWTVEEPPPPPPPPACGQMVAALLAFSSPGAQPVTAQVPVRSDLTCPQVLVKGVLYLVTQDPTTGDVFEVAGTRSEPAIPTPLNPGTSILVQMEAARTLAVPGDAPGDYWAHFEVFVDGTLRERFVSPTLVTLVGAGDLPPSGRAMDVLYERT